MMRAPYTPLWAFGTIVTLAIVISVCASLWMSRGAAWQSKTEDRYTQIQSEVHAWLVRNECKRTGYAGSEPVAVFTCSDNQVWTAYDVRRELGL